MKKVGITLRPYRVNDLDAMHALDVECFDKPFRFSRGAMRRFAEAKKARVVIAEDNDALVGFVILDIEETEEGRFGYIVTLDISPGYRRRGVAGQLMEQVEREALREGCAAVVLHVFTGNEPAIRFYAGRGFVRSHRENDFYGRGIDAWVFHKPLHSADE
ncbi:GNAT family N-acetyltransferase [Granulicella sp. L46]|uniref:GNAT family N-acetyltransferase n=1 Tax=Granulicella sp. L46 TaxID=1641865 RepID=UPI00131E7A91|nr:GNAT family N-acetyltransferase [Granulicella sp. L46]